MNSPLPLYRPDQVRAMDRHASAQAGVSANELMRRAGAAAWALLRERWPKARRIGIACGPGNNGGDGYVVAKLAKAAGCQVQIVIPAGELPRASAAGRAWSEWRELGGTTRIFDGELPEVNV